MSDHRPALMQIGRKKAAEVRRQAQASIDADRLRTVRSQERMADALRVLLNGICGPNAAVISRETGICRAAIARFLTDNRHLDPDTLHRIAMFVWRRLNAHLLLDEDDARVFDHLDGDGARADGARPAAPGAERRADRPDADDRRDERDGEGGCGLRQAAG